MNLPHAEPQREMLSLVTARIRDAYVRKPFFVDGGLDLVSVCRQMSALGLSMMRVERALEEGPVDGDLPLPPPLGERARRALRLGEVGEVRRGRGRLAAACGHLNDAAVPPLT